MRKDDEGFLYPAVDAASCVGCGLCAKVCPELHPFGEQSPMKLYAAINGDDEVRLKSSSGGIFHILAEKTISEGGVVFGARFDKAWQVVLEYADSMEGVQAFMGSKYVQANVGSAYSDAERFLSEGRKVLFSGTPCQIAGLMHFLRRPYDNLLAVDVICHGTPSPKVWGLYLDEVVSAGRKAFSEERYRRDRKGWERYGFRIACNEEDRSVSLLCNYRENNYMRAFLQDLILRPSCHDCRAKGGRSHSDITLADFWGVRQEIPQMYDGQGTGLVLVNTSKGRSSLELASFRHWETTMEQALRHNPSYSHPAVAHPKRAEFFRRLDGCYGVDSLIVECLRPGLKQRFRMALSGCKRFIKGALALRPKVCPKGSVLPDGDAGPHKGREGFPEEATVAAVRFRNKDNGWEDYNMEIKLK